MSHTGMAVLRLYKQILKEGKKLSAYNFREYALRRTRDAFRANKNLSNSEAITKQYNYGLEQLEIIKRQVLIGRSYQASNLVIEVKPAKLP